MQLNLHLSSHPLLSGQKLNSRNNNRQRKNIVNETSKPPLSSCGHLLDVPTRVHLYEAAIRYFYLLLKYDEEKYKPKSKVVTVFGPVMPLLSLLDYANLWHTSIDQEKPPTMEQLLAGTP